MGTELVPGTPSHPDAAVCPRKFLWTTQHLRVLQFTQMCWRRLRSYGMLRLAHRNSSAFRSDLLPLSAGSNGKRWWISTNVPSCNCVFHIHSFSLSKSIQLCSLLSAEWYPLYPYQLKRCNISEELNIERRDSAEYMYLSFHLLRNEFLELGMWKYF